jgi:hypothetical protein
MASILPAASGVCTWYTSACAASSRERYACFKHIFRGEMPERRRVTRKCVLGPVDVEAEAREFEGGAEDARAVMVREAAVPL